jgi:hypothetical protein
MGISPLAIYDPETYAKQLAIQRRQALAQGLLEQGSGSAGASPYGGLANAGKEVLGAFLAKRADQQLGNLYNPQPQQGGVDTGQITNMPTQGQGSSPAPVPSGVPNGPAPTPQGPVAQPQQPQQAPQTDNPPDYGNLPPQAKAIYDRIPHIPGMPAQQALNFFMSNPTGYQAEWAKIYEQSPDMKNAMFANPGDPNAQRQAVAGILNKSGTINVTRGMALTPDGKTLYPPPPAPAGFQYVTGGNGQMMLIPTPGGEQAVAGSAYAGQVPKALLTPATGYGADNMPVASNQLAMSGNAASAPQLGIGPQQPSQAQPPNITANNPLNVQSGGRDIRYSTPTAGLGQAWETLGHYGQKGINTVAAIVKTWAPTAPPQYVQSVAQALKVDPNQPLNLSDPNVKGALIDAMRPNETGNRYAPGQPAPAPTSPPAGPMRPELPAGVKPYLDKQGGDASDRHDATVAAAAESPMRINVLDNIIKLSEAGVQTGPGSEWQNSVKGYLANTPGLGKLLGSTQQNVGNFQELQKFMYQNALRNWQAAGGTGTDSQLESAAKANPNDHLFPQALQTIAKWGKASELAVQGKANAQDRFLAQNGNDPTKQIQFESAWRNAFDPKVFQYQLMSPQEKQTFAAQQLKTPQAAKAFIAKQQQLQQLGAIQ